MVINPASIDALWMMLRERPADPRYPGTYSTEFAFEDEVWKRVVKLATEIGLDGVGQLAFSGRSQPHWTIYPPPSRPPTIAGPAQAAVD